MFNYSIYIIVLISALFSDEITIHGESEPFVVDTKYPIVEWQYPSEGDTFDGNEEIMLIWEALDSSLTNESVAIFLSTSASGSYESIYSDIANTGSIAFTLPDISTAFARFKIIVTDYYAYQSESAGGYITISGEGGDNEIVGQEITITGDSPSFVVDTKYPEIELLSPNGGETYTAGAQVNVTWSAYDNSPAQNPISISLSINQGGVYDPIADGISNSGSYNVTLPTQESEYARFKIEIVDSFGYTSSDNGDEYFTIGSASEYAYADTSLTIEGDSPDFIMDTVDPIITVLYPNGGEHVLDYENVNLQWTVEDESIDNIECSVSVSSQLGGYYVVVDDNLPIYGYENSYDVDMNQPGVQEALWGRIKMDVTDGFGNTAMDKSDNYFILGDPEGTMEAQTLDEESSLIVLGWGWQEDQLIVFESGTLSFLNDGDELAILDNEGIVSSACDGGYGVIELGSLTYTNEMAISPVALKANAGVDNCEYGGDRYPGFIRGHEIIFEARYTNGTNADLTPEMEGVVFGDSVVVIGGFDAVVYPMCEDGTVDDCSGDGDCCLESMIGDGNPDCADQAYDCDLTCYDNDGGDCDASSERAGTMKSVNNINTVTTSGYPNFMKKSRQGGRDFDDYNIYRSTNMVNLRNCGGTCGTCSDNLSFNENDCVDNGYAWTDHSWDVDDNDCICLIAEHTPQTWYFDNFSMTNTTWCYHVWLMDDDTKVVKTVESCAGLAFLIGDLNGDGVWNILDIVILANCVLYDSCSNLQYSDAADMNQDGTVNILDIVILANCVGALDCG